MIINNTLSQHYISLQNFQFSVSSFKGKRNLLLPKQKQDVKSSVSLPLSHTHRINDRGEMDRINYNNATRDTVFDISAEKVQPFYAALKEFVNLLNSTEHKVTYKMKPGQ